MGIAYRKKETIYANWFLTSLQSFLVNSFNAIFESTNSVPFILVNFYLEIRNSTVSENL